MQLSPGFVLQAERLRLGEITWGQFLRLTSDTWNGRAQYLMRRWRAPMGVELADVVQELHLGVYRALGKYDPEKGPLAGFLVYNAMDKAKKWLHKQRGANLHGSCDRNPSRFDIASSVADPEGLLMLGLGEWADQDERVDYHRKWLRMADEMPNERLKLALVALAATGGGPRAAADALYADPDIRLRLRLSSERAARRVVGEAMSVVQQLSGAMSASAA